MIFLKIDLFKKYKTFYLIFV